MDELLPDTSILNTFISWSDFDWTVWVSALSLAGVVLSLFIWGFRRKKEMPAWVPVIVFGFLLLGLAPVIYSSVNYEEPVEDSPDIEISITPTPEANSSVSPSPTETTDSEATNTEEQ